jgi:hypothetical protein
VLASLLLSALAERKYPAARNDLLGALWLSWLEESNRNKNHDGKAQH